MNEDLEITGPEFRKMVSEAIAKRASEMPSKGQRIAQILDSLETQLKEATSSVVILAAAVDAARAGKTRPTWDYLESKAEKLQRDAEAVFDDVSLLAEMEHDVRPPFEQILPEPDVNSPEFWQRTCGVCDEAIDPDYTGPDGSKHLAEFVDIFHQDEPHVLAHVECGMGKGWLLA